VSLFDICQNLGDDFRFGLRAKVAFAVEMDSLVISSDAMKITTKPFVDRDKVSFCSKVHFVRTLHFLDRDQEDPSTQGFCSRSHSFAVKYSG
jgi:hypothetical protein